MSDWQPAQYLKFKKERTQPSIDLLRRIDLSAPKRVLDIGCGPGNSTVLLKERWPNADVVGLDSSKNMIDKARQEYPNITWLHQSVTEDLSALGQFDVVFSNAALQWMPDHEALLPKLFALVREGGVLAVQVPCVKHLPIYDSIRRLIDTDAWAPSFKTIPEYPKHFPYAHYYDLLCPLTEKISLWQTDYIHVLPSPEAIVEWYKGTGLRPFLDCLPTNEEKDAFSAAYLERIAQAYPTEKDGNVLLPFTRIFFLAEK